GRVCASRSAAAGVGAEDVESVEVDDRDRNGVVGRIVTDEGESDVSVAVVGAKLPRELVRAVLESPAALVRVVVDLRRVVRDVGECKPEREAGGGLVKRVDLLADHETGSAA